MSATTYGQQFVTVAKPVSRAPTRGGSREDEFRAALDRYMASYVEAQTIRRGPVTHGDGEINWPLRLLARLLPITRG